MTTAHGTAPPPPDVARRVRRQAGLSSDQVAAPLGVTGRAVRAWEMGGCTPTPEHGAAWGQLLARLADALALGGPEQ